MQNIAGVIILRPYPQKNQKDLFSTFGLTFKTQTTKQANEHNQKHNLLVGVNINNTQEYKILTSVYYICVLYSTNYNQKTYNEALIVHNTMDKTAEYEMSKYFWLGFIIIINSPGMILH